MNDVILETHELSRHFGGFTAVDRVSLQVRRGSFHAVIGPNGAGKTTLFNLLSGALHPSSGRVIFKGADITGLPPHQISRRGLGRSFQITNLFPNLTVLENVRLAVQARGGKTAWNFLSPVGRFSRFEKRAREVLSQVNLAGKEAVVAHTLSHGDKRKLELGLLLASDPELLLLDEPTAGMSREEVPAIIDVIRRIKASGEQTIMMVEHKMDIVLSISDTITVLQSGAVIAEGPPAFIIENPQVRSAYLGGVQ
ncbi:MAG: ABC transporter ATP-binding protein [Actinobacteria bacterium]|nr:ABC transporter ATP-binding protein [Actinomycetota bacterium]